MQSPRPGGSYGFGLSVRIDGKTQSVQSVSHGGALFGSFCRVVVNFRTKRFGVVNFTGRRNREINTAMEKWANSATRAKTAPGK